MRRRIRPIRKRIRPGTPTQLTARAQTMLRRAHQMMENGEHAQAAQVFERLAQGARDLGRLKMAPNLYLQAGRANLLSGEQEKATDCIFDGLGIIAGAEKWPVLARIGKRTVAELNSLGYPEISEEVYSWLKDKLPEPIDSYPQIKAPSKPLPLKCPSCGGALRPGEVEMLDSNTGECPYCGSSVRAE